MVDVDSFLHISRLIHSDKYCYDKVVYINSKTKVEIVCPIHGLFYKTPSKHTTSKQGCPSCAKKLYTPEAIKDICESYKTQGFIKSYKLPSTVNNKSYLTFKCSCGKDYSIQIRKLSSERKSGCSYCLRKLLRKSDHDYLDYFKAKWGDRYCYLKFKNEGANNPCTITCKEHGDFITTPSKHKLRSGCPKCANINSKFDNITLAERYKDTYKKKVCYIYFLDFGDNTYKIGISENTKERFNVIRNNLGNFKCISKIKTNRYNAIVCENLGLNLVKSGILGGRHLSEVFTYEEDIDDLILRIKEECEILDK